MTSSHYDYIHPNLKTEINEAVKTARQLGYFSKYITQLREAKSGYEISRIMATARKDKYGDLKKEEKGYGKPKNNVPYFVSNHYRGHCGK